MYDVCIIGAGTSGLMAAIAASQSASAIVIDGNKKPGQKLKLTGGGRCNVTNNRPVDDVIAHIPGNGKFLYSAFSQFNNYDIIDFFNEHGVQLIEEDHGRLFPYTHRSQTIVDTLIDVCQKQNVQFHLKDKVEHLQEINGQFEIMLESQEHIYARCVIIATGGITYRQTGSTGDGFKWAKSFGHTVTPLYPTEAPLISNAPFIQSRQLQGLSLQNIELSVIGDNDKVLEHHVMDMIFTHFGLSGPAALRCSMAINQWLKTHDVATVKLNLYPQWKTQNYKSFFEEKISTCGNKSIKNALSTLAPERYLSFLLSQSHIDESKPLKQITQKEILNLIKQCQGLEIPIIRTYPLEKAFVTGGGVSVKEINPKTMESKKQPQLFFCGEVLDINGYTGGYNITAAFSTGYVAGIHAAEIASYFHYESY